jgi:SAM-dependent methyltransferase
MDTATRSPRTSDSVYAPPRRVTRVEDCFFYHTQDVPGYGTIQGPWDLRGRVDEYLGGVNLSGKRVLEMGTASGFLCMEMEKRGAEVVAYDLSEDFDGDVVPFGGGESEAEVANRRAFNRQLNNGFWLVHGAHESAAKVVYGTIYDVPAEIGEVDVATFGCILLHVRDPYRALASAARLVRDTIIVTDHPVHWRLFPSPPVTEPIPEPPGGQPGELLEEAHRLHGDPGWRQREERLRERARAAETTLQALLDAPIQLFLPHFTNQKHTWWCFRPQAICAMLSTLGFPHSTVTWSKGYSFSGHRESMLTVVARRG